MQNVKGWNHIKFPTGIIIYHGDNCLDKSVDVTDYFRFEFFYNK